MKTDRKLSLALMIFALAACNNKPADQENNQKQEAPAAVADKTDNGPQDKQDNSDPRQNTDNDHHDNSDSDINVADDGDDDQTDEGVHEIEIIDYVEPDPDPSGATCQFYFFQYDLSLNMLPIMLPMPRRLWEENYEEKPQVVLSARESMIAYPEEDPPYYYGLKVRGKRGKASTTITMPGYSDTLPLFERADDWADGEKRCYIYDDDSADLSQDEAYDLYVSIAELTTGVTMDQTVGRRNVVGIRGASPGQFRFNDDMPNRFNDTIVLLWIDSDQVKHVREFPVNTNTGVQKTRKSGQASALPANRRYRYINGTHKNYNALQISEYSYNTRDDANNNGHIDNDRNSWLAPTTGEQDYDRTGSGHNIHYGKATDLFTSPVSNWSAGCQVIPGMENWTMFITNAWTGLNDQVDYFLVDVRDIDKRVWGECTADGSHDCPYQITFNDAGSFSASGTLNDQNNSDIDNYNCALTTNESGPEAVYFFTWDGKNSAKKTITVSVSSPDGGDPDIHLLDADDQNACLIRNDKTFTKEIGPGRYYIIVDTYVNKEGIVKTGSYDLSVTLK